MPRAGKGAPPGLPPPTQIPLQTGGGGSGELLSSSPVASVHPGPIRSGVAGEDLSGVCTSAYTHPERGPCVSGMTAPESRAAAPAALPDPPGALRALLLATGDAGGSWPRCVLPFGAVALLAGGAATAITFSLRGPRLDLAQGVSLAALGAGLGLLAAAFLCWRARRRRRWGAGRGVRREPGTP